MRVTCFASVLVAGSILMALTACTDTGFNADSLRLSAEARRADDPGSRAQILTPTSAPPPQTGDEGEARSGFPFCVSCDQVKVLKVIDGDTLDIGEGRVRFYGINTPERGEACYDEATTFTRSLVGKNVRLESGPRASDRFGRIHAYVYELDGDSIDAQLVSAGLAAGR